MSVGSEYNTARRLVKAQNIEFINWGQVKLGTASVCQHILKPAIVITASQACIIFWKLAFSHYKNSSAKGRSCFRTFKKPEGANNNIIGRNILKRQGMRRRAARSFQSSSLSSAAKRHVSLLSLQQNCWFTVEQPNRPLVACAAVISRQFRFALAACSGYRRRAFFMYCGFLDSRDYGKRHRANFERWRSVRHVVWKKVN